MAPPQKTIAAAFLRTMALFSGLVLAAMAALGVTGSLAQFEREAAHVRAEFMRERKAMVRSEVEGALAMIRDMRDGQEESLREGVRRRVLEGVEVARRLYEANRSWRGRGEVREMVAATLRSMRFLSGRGYFFVLSRDGVQVLNAARPDLEGREVLGLADANGRKLFEDMLRTAESGGEGFVEYAWTRPGAAGEEHAKLSFVHLFKPLGWIIGGGEYREDAEEALQREVLRRIELQRFGEGGYLFAATFKGLGLAGPAKGRDMLAIGGRDGVDAAHRLIAAAQAGGGFVEYAVPAELAGGGTRKVSYVAPVEGWDWYVGGGVPIAGVEAEIARRRAMLWDGLRLRLAVLAGGLGLLLLVQYLVARRVAGRIRDGVAGFLESLRRSRGPGSRPDPGDQPYAELAEAASSALELVEARARAEDALRDSEARYRRLVDNARDAMFLVDGEGRIRDVNLRACEALGYSREELTAMNLWEVDTAVPRERFLADMGGGSREVPPLLRGMLRRKDGSSFPVEVKTALFTEHGRTLSLGLARDVSQREAAERELLKAKAAAESASRAKSQFMANMSHELRTPLNAIMGMTRILRDSGGSPEQAEFLDIIRRSSEHLLRIIADILDLSGIEAGRVRVVNEPFSLRQSLAPLLKSCAVQAWRKGLAFEWSVDDELPERLVGDPGRLAQVLFNLVNNALKFTEAGEVRVRVAGDGAGPPAAEGQVRLACIVRDTGPGISPDKLAAVFERFVQGEDALTRRHGGVGLGLSISRELARLMGGDLTASSEPGQGSIFTFTVRVDRDLSPEPPARPAPSAGSASLRPLRLLVVDDEPVSRLLTSRMLRMAGHAVRDAGDGAEALDILSREAFDAVLMDVQMPGLNGLDATRRIRGGQVPGCDPAIPVVALTAYALEAERSSCLDAGMSDFAAKPLDIDDLLLRLERLTWGRPGAGAAAP